MNRRNALLALAGAAASARAQQHIRYAEYYRCLPDYLTSLTREAYARRSAALAALTTPDAIRERQRWVRRTFWQLVGGEPERTPLNLRTANSFTRQGYRVDNITYESQPGLLVSANLYIPTSGSGPFPGVLFQAGHSLEGKAATPYQKCCQALAKLGYVVLAPDPMGQGERRTGLSDGDEEHSRPGRLMLLVGDTATRLQTWDAVRSLDVLASHPSVDAKRLASTGQSGGGTLTMFLAAVDDRLACAAVSCGNTENVVNGNFFPPGATDDAEQNFVGGGPAGFDRWDTLYGLAPKPLWIAASARDYFGTYSPRYLEDGRAEFARLREIYARLGRENAVEWYETAVPHALSHDLRLRIYRFFDRHLKGGDGTVREEPPVTPEPEKLLTAGRPRATVLESVRRKPPAQRSGDWKSLLAYDPPPGRPARVLGTADGEGCAIEGIEIESGAPGVIIPAWRFVPKQSPNSRVLLALEPRGRNGRWREDDLYHRLAQAGWTVVAFDVRGIGDMSPEVSRGNPFYTRPHSEEEHWAWAALILGKPMLGQRVSDILAVAAATRGRQRTVLATSGHPTLPATLAAALDPRIDLLYTAGGLESWSSLLAKPDYTEPFSNFLPGVLARTDLPAIRSSLGTRLKQGKAWELGILTSL